jgi:hypothetical protein
MPISSSPSRYTMATDIFKLHYSPVHPGSISSPSYSRSSEQRSMLLPSHPPIPSKNSDPLSLSSPNESFTLYPPYDWTYKQHQVTPLPPISYSHRPHRLEDIASRDTILLVVSLFFDFLYPLTPCVHQPSFMAGLDSRKDERDPLFSALVMSMVASTLVQVPRSYFPMERSVMRKLAQTCHEGSRLVSITSYDPPTSTHVIIRFLSVHLFLGQLLSNISLPSRDYIYHFCQGHNGRQHAAFGEAVHIAVTLRMHEETSYEGLDPIESEIRRRTLWLLFGGLCPSPFILLYLMQPWQRTNQCPYY